MNLGTATAKITLDHRDLMNNADAAEGRLRSLDGAAGSTSGWSRLTGILGTAGKVIGGLAIGGGIGLIAGGSKAAWGQVDAIEQATFALRAYEKDATKVDAVLQDLLGYAKSEESGGLFWSQDLFAAAQGLKVYGAETENLSEYVQIMSRSVGLGTGNWDEMNRVIGRVGSTGRMTGDDFDMLTKMGYQLDDSLRNTNITWEELFSALDQGIPADVLAGQADTIRGRMLWLRGALQDVGAAFLGIDRDTGKFIEGGLGSMIFAGMKQARTGLLAVAPLVGFVGRGIAAIVSNTVALGSKALRPILRFGKGFKNVWDQFRGDWETTWLGVGLQAMAGGFQELSKMGGPVGRFFRNTATGLYTAGKHANQFGHYLVHVWRTGNLFHDFLNEMPQPLARMARGFGEIVNVGRNVVQAFGEGGMAGAFRVIRESLPDIGRGLREIGGSVIDAFRGIDWSAIGTSLRGIAIDLFDVAVNVVSWAVGVLADIGSWFVDTALPAAWDFIVDLPGIAVNVAEWTAGKISDLWEWLRNYTVGGIAGDGTGGPTDTTGQVTLEEVAVNVLDWGVNALGDLWGAIQDAAEAAWKIVSGNAHEVGPVNVEIGDFSVEIDFAGMWQSLEDSFKSATTMNPAAALQIRQWGQELGVLLADMLIEGIQSGLDSLFGGGGLSGDGGGGGRLFGGGSSGVWGRAAGFVTQGLRHDWMDDALSLFFDGLRQGFSRKFNEFKADIERQWDEFWTVDFFGRDIDLKVWEWEIDIPEPDWPDWLTTAPQWWKNIQAGRFPWDNGSGAAAVISSSLGGVASAIEEELTWIDVQDLNLGIAETVGVDIDADVDMSKAESAVSSALESFTSWASSSISDAFASIFAEPESITPSPEAAPVPIVPQDPQGFGLPKADQVLQAGIANWKTVFAQNVPQVVTSVGSQFAQMPPAVQAPVKGVQTVVSTGFAGMTGIAVGATAGMSSGVVSQFGGMQSGASGEASTMEGNVVGSSVGMATGATAASLLMAAGVLGGATTATGSVSGESGKWVGIVAATAGPMAAAGMSAGLMAGMGVAAGLLAALPLVASAANQIISTVDRALASAARIASPSRLTAYHGRMLTEGIATGLTAPSALRSLSTASGQVMSAAGMAWTPPARPTYGGGGTVVHGGPQTVNATIHTQSSLTPSEKQQLTRDIAEASRAARDVAYIEVGVKP